MSMDKLLKADKHEFVGKPFSFDEFAKQALAAHTRMEQMMGIVKDPQVTVQKQLVKVVGFSDKESGDVVAHVNSALAAMRGPERQEYNFDIEEGLDDQALEDTRLRTPVLLQHERERRLNKQNKSIALRAMKYDFMDPALLAQRKDGLESLKHWEDILLKGLGKVQDSWVGLEEFGNDLPEMQKQYCTDQQKDDFLDDGLVSLRTANPPWALGDIIVHASVYLGYSRSLEYHEVRLGRLMKVTDRLLLSGSSTLRDLKKAFHCPADYMVLDDVSKRNICHEDLCKNRFPSSFFFIHDTFYLDMEPEGTTDTSKCVRQWAKSREPAVGEVKFDFMKTPLSKLHCRLGQPYVYVHQGNCEHLIVFTDLHFRTLPDPVGPYPIRLRERAFRRITCAACGNDGAAWSVMECEWMPGTPTYMCDKCYRDFGFYDDGRKRCKFKAVPYFDRKAMDNYELFLSKLQMKPNKKVMKFDLPDEDEEVNQEKEDDGDEPLFIDNRRRFNDLFAASAIASAEIMEEPLSPEKRHHANEERKQQKRRLGYEEDSDDIGSDEWQSGKEESSDSGDSSTTEESEAEEEDPGKEPVIKRTKRVAKEKKPVVKKGRVVVKKKPPSEERPVIKTKPVKEEPLSEEEEQPTKRVTRGRSRKSK